MKKLKSENGAIAILVLISLVFLTTFLISSYVIMSNKMQSQRKVISDTKDIYENYDLNQMYESYFDKSRDGLPDNVEQLEYIESTGTQYINTEIIENLNLSCEIKFMFNEFSSSIYGPHMLSGANIFLLVPRRVNNGQVFVHYNNGDVTTSYNWEKNKIYEVSTRNDKIIVNGETKLEGINKSETFSSSSYVYLMAYGGGLSNAALRFVGKLYYCKIYDGDTLVRCFIPALDENGMACLYDKVEKKFYYNSGTGTFNYKKKDSQNMQLTKVNYIESTGTQYIDTGVKPSNSTKVDIKFMYNSLNGFVYGSRTSSSGSDAHEFIINASGLVFPQFDGQHSEVSSSYNKIGEEYILSNSQSGAYINGNLIKSYNTATFSSKHSMFLFGLNQNGTVEYRKFIGRLYYCKIYNGDTLVRDFVPVIDGSNIACLYDRVEKKCYYNAGTGTFSYGE